MSKPISKVVSIAALLIGAAQAAPGTAATFLFIRHAESTANAGTATTAEEYIDPPLTALGEQQALDLEPVLAAYDVTTIFTSAYQRTQETIAPTAAHFGLTPIVEASTNEWYVGDITSLADLASANLYGVIGDWAAGDTSAKADLPNAESLDDVVARVLPTWDQIFNEYKDQPGVVVLVGHGVSTGYVLPFFAENVSLDFAFAHGLQNTGIVEVESINGEPYVTNWQGIQVAIPEPSTWVMLLAGAGALALGGARKTRLARS